MITISVITPTFRREGLLARCVESVLSQQLSGAQIEQIVVNDAGKPLGYAPWMEDPRVRILDTFRTERSVARNTGAALSRGQWLYFLDDDDYALPGAFDALLSCAQSAPDAVHVYGAYRIYNETLRTITTISPKLEGNAFAALVAGEAFPPPSSWIRRDAFFAAGGFDPLIVPGEDAELFRRIALVGPLSGTSHIVTAARIAHPRTSTTSISLQHQRWQQGTDKILGLAETLPRLAKDTRFDPYWRGRCVREYIGSAWRQFRQGRLILGFSRFVACCRLALPHGLLPQFWLGVCRLEQRGDVPPVVLEPITAEADYSEKTTPEAEKIGAEILPAELCQ